MSEIVIKDTLDQEQMYAFLRAVESKRGKALIQDAWADRLAGKRGEEIVNTLSDPDNWRLGVALRSRIYDELLLRTIEQEEVDTVINLGAGLDTRPYRLALPATLRWIDVEKPETLAYKEELLQNAQPVCRYEQAPLDIADQEARQALLARVCAENHRIFVLTEGLISHLTVEQVSALAADLHAGETIHWWLTEFIAPTPGNNYSASWNAIAAQGMQMHFIAPGGAAFFKEHGWKISEFRSLVREALRLKQNLRLNWFFRLMLLLLPNKPENDNPQLNGFILLTRNRESQDKAE